MKLRTVSGLLGGLAAGLFAPSAEAEPIGPARFCETYPSAPACATGPASCQTCHIETAADNPTWNDFGLALQDALAGAPFDDNVAAALASIEAQDSDGDGFANLDEISAGSHPGDAASTPADATCPDDLGDLPYTLCEYDPPFAYKRVSLDFCGVSPTYEAMTAFREMGYDAQLAEIDATLQTCLDSEYWVGKEGVLWQLAYPKVRPVRALKGGRDPSDIEQLRTADYYNDIILYVWSQIDGHDSRSVLTAEFFVLQDGLSFEVVPDIGFPTQTACTEDADCPANETCLDDICECQGCVEAVPAERRRGLLTTRWNLLYNTMFTAIPRTTAAQAYRAFLGLDIAKQQGLQPVPGEPVDYDAKGVQEAECATCHSTLDPLAYAFTTYTGYGPGGRATYVPNRMTLPPIVGQAPNIGDTPESGVIFGEPVADLREWADVAADSDQFAINAVNDYWTRLIGRPPATDDETAQFTALWTDLKTKHSYSIEGMLADLIRTEAYGAP